MATHTKKTTCFEVAEDVGSAQSTSVPLASVRESILGTRVNAIHMGMALEQLDLWIREQHRQYVCCTPAHSLMDGYNDPELRAVFNASGMTVPDGMAVVWLLKIKGFRHVGRVYGPDLLKAVCEYGCRKGYRHYFYGGAPGVTETLVKNLSTQFPGLQVVGICTPPFRALTPEEDHTIAAEINESGADVLWVGLGSPKQEFWMRTHMKDLNVPVMVGVGAAFDFLSGAKPQAPVWMQRSGLEWAFRLMTEPKRLWPRYRHYPRFVLLVLLESLGLLKMQPYPSHQIRNS